MGKGYRENRLAILEQESAPPSATPATVERGTRIEKQIQEQPEKLLIQKRRGQTAGGEKTIRKRNK